MINKKFLYITSYFPPLGGPGVQRQLYYIYYAEKFGWKANVLTTKDVLYHVHDHTLLKKIPQTTKIFRTESLEFGRVLYIIKKIYYFILNKKENNNKIISGGVSPKILRIGRLLRNWITIVDDRILWIPFALPVAVKIIKENKLDVIIARGGPYSNTILGYFVSKITNKPLVLDLADPWLDYPYFYIPTNIHKKIIGYFEKKVFTNANQICVASPIIKERIVSRYKNIDPKTIHIITNGYDSELFEFSEIEQDKSEKFTLAHVGTLSWIRYEAFSTLCNSLKELLIFNPNFTDKINFEIIGHVDDDFKKLVDLLELNKIINFRGYISHSESTRIMSSANLLFLPIDNKLTNKDGCYVIPGKIYDYIGSKTKILMIGPSNSDAASLILSNDFGVVFEVNQIDEIKNYFINLLSHNWKILLKNDNENSKKFERKYLAEKFFEILNSVLCD